MAIDVVNMSQKMQQDAFSHAQQMAAANNQFNLQQAQAQREWSAKMANTAHQREVADLKAAGLNPILSAGGQGAPTPSTETPKADTTAAHTLGQLTSQALSMLGNVYNAQTSAETARRQMEKQAQIAREQMSTQRDIAYRQMTNDIIKSNIAAGASVYGASSAASAQRYAAQMHYKGTQYQSNSSYNAQLKTAMLNGDYRLAGQMLQARYNINLANLNNDAALKRVLWGAGINAGSRLVSDLINAWSRPKKYENYNFYNRNYAFRF